MLLRSATGKWPEQTIFVLEIRRAATQASIDIGGVSQTDRITIEVEVKDSDRFKATGGWGFFDFTSRPALLAAATQLESGASCYACHRTNTAVENTFVQFYPDLMDVARKLGTVKATYDPNHKIQ